MARNDDIWTPDIEDIAGSTPTHLGDQPPFAIATKEPDLAWRARFAENRADQLTALPAAICEDREFSDLATWAKTMLHGGLVGFGGWQVALPALDQDLDRVVSRGFLLDGAGARQVKGQPSDCHANSLGVWAKAPTRTAMMTGYALSEDGMWREHSWAVERTKTGTRVIETTTSRVAYFGFIRSPEEISELVSEKPRRSQDLVERMRRVLSHLRQETEAANPGPRMA
jgi:hypothetical protein